jgi:predicted DNA-binding transcriptional regulator AlpA
MSTAVALPEPKTVPSPALYTAEDVGRLLQCTSRTVRSLDDSGTLPGRCQVGRMVRWRVKDIDSWIASGCLKPKGI